MRDAAALQIHTIRTETRVASASAALVPLVPFAALLLAIGGMLGAPFDPLVFLGGAAAVCACALPPERWTRLARAGLCAPALFALAFVPAARAGALRLADRLFAASEAVNAYAYIRLADAAENAGAERLAALLCAVLLGALCVAACRRRSVAVLLFLGVVFTQAYFGVTPGVWRNVLLFAGLALPLASGGREWSAAAVLLAGAAVVTLAVFLLAPRPNAAVEAYSEHLRDELGAAAMTLTQDAPQPEREPERAREESRHHEENAAMDGAGESAASGFERQTRTEREISLPHRVDWLRAALWLLLAVALLVVPFFPFLLVNRAKRRAEELHGAFADADNAAAIRAMFAHTMDWLRAGGLQTENRPYAQCAAAVEALTSAAYAARYAQTAPIWREAVYSDHAMTDAQREAVRALLDETAETIYEKASRRARLRMRYVDGLCGS